MLKNDSTNIKYFSTNLVVLCGENMISKKVRISCSVTVSRLEFVSAPIADQLQPNVLETALCRT